jgi:hypothetical protein
LSKAFGLADARQDKKECARMPKLGKEVFKIIVKLREEGHQTSISAVEKSL